MPKNLAYIEVCILSLACCQRSLPIEIEEEEWSLSLLKCFFTSVEESRRVRAWARKRPHLPKRRQDLLLILEEKAMAPQGQSEKRSSPNTGLQDSHRTPTLEMLYSGVDFSINSCILYVIYYTLSRLDSFGIIVDIVANKARAS